MSRSLRNTLQGVCMLLCAGTTVLCLLAAPLVPWQRSQSPSAENSTPPKISMIPMDPREMDLNQEGANWQNKHHIDQSGLHLQSSSIFQIALDSNAKSLSFQCLYGSESQAFPPVKITIDGQDPPQLLFSGLLQRSSPSLEVRLDTSQHRKMFMRVHFESQDSPVGVQVDCVRPSFTID